MLSMSSVSTDNQISSFALRPIYDERIGEELCCPRKFLNGSGISFFTFHSCRMQMASIKEQQQEALQTTISAMMTMAGKLMKKGRNSRTVESSIDGKKISALGESLYQDYTDSLGEMGLQQTDL